jgi:hypothetical protein
MIILPQEATIRSDDNEQVELWYVQGMPNKYFPTKMVAEAIARRAFPDEDSYQRIFFRRFIWEGA